MMHLRTILILIISAVIVIANILIGHFFPPNGIMFTPGVLIILAVLIGFGSNQLRAFWKSILLVSFIGLHDIGIKTYAGGIHDYPGQGWIHAMLLIGLIPAFAILAAAIFTGKNDSVLIKWISVLTFPALMWLHALAFAETGL